MKKKLTKPGFIFSVKVLNEEFKDEKNVFLKIMEYFPNMQELTRLVTTIEDEECIYFIFDNEEDAKTSFEKVKNRFITFCSEIQVLADFLDPIKLARKKKREEKEAKRLKDCSDLFFIDKENNRMIPVLFACEELL